MDRIEDLVASGARQDTRRGYVPALPMDTRTFIGRIPDAFRVLSGKANAVQWPQQREEDSPKRRMGPPSPPRTPDKREVG